MNIILDVDDVILKWHEAYIERYNLPMPTQWIPYDQIKDHLAELKKDKSFWLSLRPKHLPNFMPTGYLSARGIPTQWTKDSLKLIKAPGRTKVKHVNWGESKIDILKSKNCDIFVDDKIETFNECHENGICCLLMDTPQNQHLKTNLRIYDLDINKILKKYKLWKF